MAESKSKREQKSKAATARLFILDLSGGRVLSTNPDGSDKRVLATDCQMPDGVAVDVEGGHIYWTNMGVPNLNDGYIDRADLDGQNRKTIIPAGVTFTPKQIHLDKDSGKLKWCVGITVDSERGHIYWTQKGPDNAELGSIFRANIEIPPGENASTRTDIEVLFDKLPEPIDLELDLKNRVLYWTDRGNPPRGNSVSRASIDTKPEAPEIVLTHLMKGIGIALDVPGERMFVTDFAGSIYSARLDGTEERNFLYAQGNLTGIVYAEI